MGALTTLKVSVCAQGEDNLGVPSTVFGMLYFIRGALNACSGPIGNALLSSDILSNAKFGYGTGNYGPLIMFVGIVYAMAAFIGLCWKE